MNPVARLACCVLVVASCSPTPPAGTCPDSLSGVWQADIRAPSGETVRFHLVDADASVAIYPMYDDSFPPPSLAASSDTAPYDKRTAAIAYAPASFHIHRRGTSLVGTRTFRATRDGVVCTVTRPAAIRSCKRDSLELSWVPVVAIDWPGCETRGAARYQRLSLARIR